MDYPFLRRKSMCVGKPRILKTTDHIAKELLRCVQFCVEVRRHGEGCPGGLPLGVRLRLKSIMCCYLNSENLQPCREVCGASFRSALLAELYGLQKIVGKYYNPLEIAPDAFPVHRSSFSIVVFVPSRLNHPTSALAVSLSVRSKHVLDKLDCFCSNIAV